LDVVVAAVASGVGRVTDVGVREAAGAVDDGAASEGDGDEWDTGSSEPLSQPDISRSALTTSEPTTTPARLTGHFEKVGRGVWPECNQRNMRRA
jgi:hypothetical protein